MIAGGGVVYLVCVITKPEKRRAIKTGGNRPRLLNSKARPPRAFFYDTIFLLPVNHGIMSEEQINDVQQVEEVEETTEDTEEVEE